MAVGGDNPLLFGDDKGGIALSVKLHVVHIVKLPHSIKREGSVIALGLGHGYCSGTHLCQFAGAVDWHLIAGEHKRVVF